MLVLGVVSQTSTAAAQEDAAGGQSRESMANDSTASQWSFQLAYEARDWRDDEIAPGVTRPAGNKNYWQFRLVAPLDKSLTGLPFNILPRLTLRNEEAQDGRSGAGNAELFALIIPYDWGTGRFGIGPQVNFPADDEQIGSTAWRYGLATAVLQRAANDKIMTGFLIQQAWGKTDQSNPDAHVASPIAIQPVFNYSLPNLFYLNIGETAFSYNWHAKEWLVPLGVRFGRLWIGDSSTWNFYGEYRTTVVYENWPGSAYKHAFRLNVSYTIPI
jgi:hypothetical protein